jgi:hypothetical protein
MFAFKMFFNQGVLEARCLWVDLLGKQRHVRYGFQYSAVIYQVKGA